MVPVSFRYAPDGAVFTDDVTLVKPLAHALGRVLRLERLPSELPLVGHCPVADRWCVFAREPGDSEVRGVVLSTPAYAEVGYDPFVAAAAHLRGESVVAAVRLGPLPAPPEPCNAADLEDPLRTAYGGFTAGNPEDRPGPYVSALPAGLAAEISPLTCVFADAPAAADARGEVFAAEPDHPAANTPVHERPPADEWHARDLARGGDSALATPPAPADTGHAPEPDMIRRLATLEHRLAATRAALAAGLVTAVVVGAAGGVLLDRHIRRVDAQSAKLATLAEGLGVSAPPDEVASEVTAHLHDLASVAVQSGAWQAGLQRRGVEPGRFLGQLVDLAGHSDALLAVADDAAPLRKLAAQSAPLTALAPSAEPLSTLAAGAEPLADLAQQHDALASLAKAQPQLTGLAASAKSLGSLARAADDLEALAGARADLSRLAKRRVALEGLAERATPLTTMADQGAALMVFFERYQGALADLADQQPVLTDLADRHRSLERLVEDSPALAVLAGSQPLRQLVDRSADLRALVGELDKVLALADHADELLSSAPPPRQRPLTPAPHRDSGRS